MPRILFNICMVLLLGVLSFAEATSMQRFILSVENQRTEGNSLKFEISLFNISEADIYLSESDFVLCFNHNAFFANPRVVATNPDDNVLDWYEYDTSIQQDSILFISLISPEVASKADLNERAIYIPAMSREVVCSVSLTSISISQGESGLCWLNGDLFKSAISEYDAIPPFTIRFVEEEAAFAEPEEFKFEGVNTSVDSEADTAPVLRLYPQPAIDYIVVETPARTSAQDLEVRDMRGTLKSEQRLSPSDSSEVRIEVADFSAGVYQVLITDPNTGETVLARSFVVLN